MPAGLDVAIRVAVEIAAAAVGNLPGCVPWRGIGYTVGTDNLELDGLADLKAAARDQHGRSGSVVRLVGPEAGARNKPVLQRFHKQRTPKGSLGSFLARGETVGPHSPARHVGPLFRGENRGGKRGKALSGPKPRRGRSRKHRPR